MSIMSIERGITGHVQKHKPLKDVWQAMCINLNVNLWWGTHHISFMHSLLSSTSISLLRDWTSLQFNYQKNMHILSSVLYKEKTIQKNKIKNKKTRTLENRDNFSYSSRFTNTLIHKLLLHWQFYFNFHSISSHSC